MAEGRPVQLSGYGLHSGIHSTLTITRREVSKAMQFACPWLRFPGFTPLESRDLIKLPRSARRATILGSEPVVIQTPEHLLATLLFFADQPLDVHCDAVELPGLDGSALPFREALSRIAPGCATQPRWREYSADLTWEYIWSHGHIRVRPAQEFKVHYILDRQNIRQEFILEDALTAWKEILPARTFAFHSEWQAAVSAGLMAGAGLDSGLLLAETVREHTQLAAMHPDWSSGPFPLLNQANWRMENELVKHKILDLLGDLALAGLALPRLALEIRNGGHSINHMLLEKLSMN